MPKTSVKPHVRWMIRRDMEEIMAIERTAFADPWGEENFLQCLKSRNTFGAVAESAEKVIGYMIYEMHKKEIQILTMAVHPDMARSGIGSAMIDKMKVKLSSHRRSILTAEVPESWLQSQLFLRRHGFRATRFTRKVYDNDEGAILFQWQAVCAVCAECERPLDHCECE